jgi:hypothetical protein
MARAEAKSREPSQRGSFYREPSQRGSCSGASAALAQLGEREGWGGVAGRLLYTVERGTGVPELGSFCLHAIAGSICQSLPL